MTLPVSVIILTYNEEKNIEACLESLQGWVDEIFVVDSDSSDNTLEIAKKYTDKIFENPFDNYSQQRNWALGNLPLKTEWVMNIDADHRITPELRDEMIGLFEKGIDIEIKGFLASRRTIFMGRWIRHGGHYPVYHAFLFRKGYGSCEEKLYDQHFIVEGKTKTLSDDIIDIISDSLDKFIERHNRWATLEAMQINSLDGNSGKVISANPSGHEIEKRRHLREKYYSYPLFFRVFFYYIYRYFLKLGFLDGREGLIFHFLQGFWFRFLVDAKIYEIREKKRISS